MRQEHADDTLDAGYCETYVGRGCFGCGRVYVTQNGLAWAPFFRKARKTLSALHAPKTVAGASESKAVIVVAFMVACWLCERVFGD